MTLLHTSNDAAAPLPRFTDWLERDRDSMRKGERTRTDLLIAGARFLACNPLDRLTVAGICKLAGVAHGTFYVYFSDRNALVGALLSAFAGYVQVTMHEAARIAGDGVRNTTAAYISLFENNAGLMKSLVVGVDAFPEARAAFQHLNHEWAQAVVRSARRRGDPRSTEDLMRRAYALGGMVDQYLTALFVMGDPMLTSLSEDREAVLEMLTELWKRGMEP